MSSLRLSCRELMSIILLMCYAKHIRAGPSIQSPLREADVDLQTDPGILANKLMCFGDYNGDRFTDVFMASKDGKNLYIHLSAKGTYSQTAEYSYTIATVSNSQCTKISSVAAADTNLDGKMDVVVYCANDNKIVVLTQDSRGQLKSDTKHVLTGVNSEPAIVDFNGDQRPDFLYREGSGTTLATGTAAGFDVDTTYGISLGRSYFSIGFLDLDGDCRPDFFVATGGTGSDPTAFKVITGAKNDKFPPSRARTLFSVPSSVKLGQVTFADFNNDGWMDLLVPVSNKNVGEIRIFLNTPPESSSKLCTANKQFFSSIKFSKPDWTYDISNVITDYKLEDSSPQLAISSDLRIRVGDINRDGFPDLLIPLTDKSIRLVISAGDGIFTKPRGSSDISVEGETILNAVFTDVGSNGVLDIVGITDSKTFMFLNDYEPDAFFIKTLGLNGLSKQKKPYGVNQVGVTTQTVVSDTLSQTTRRVCSQLPQNTHLALGTPFCLISLGQNKKVTVFAMGLHVKGTDSNKVWEKQPGFIPNSQLILIPHPPTSPDKWEFELFFINQNESLLNVGIGCLTTLVALGIVAGYLHYRQYLEDKRDKRQRHMFAF
eukprot:626997_1